MHEVQHLVTAPTTRLVPNPVSQYTGHDGRETDHGEDAQLPRRRERPGRQQKQRSRYGESNLVRKQSQRTGKNSRALERIEKWHSLAAFRAHELRAGDDPLHLARRRVAPSHRPVGPAHP